MEMFVCLDKGAGPELLMNRMARDSFKFGPVTFLGLKTRSVVLPAIKLDDFM